MKFKTLLLFAFALLMPMALSAATSIKEAGSNRAMSLGIW